MSEKSVPVGLRGQCVRCEFFSLWKVDKGNRLDARQTFLSSKAQDAVVKELDGASAGGREKLDPVIELAGG